MKKFVEYDACIICKRPIKTSCSRCQRWAILFIIFTVSDIVATIQFELGIFGICGVVLWFLLSLLFLIGSFYKKKIISNADYIEIIA